MAEKIIIQCTPSLFNICKQKITDFIDGIPFSKNIFDGNIELSIKQFPVVAKIINDHIIKRLISRTKTILKKRPFKPLFYEKDKVDIVAYQYEKNEDGLGLLFKFIKLQKICSIGISEITFRSDHENRLIYLSPYDYKVFKRMRNSETLICNSISELNPFYIQKSYLCQINIDYLYLAWMYDCNKIKNILFVPDRHRNAINKKIEDEVDYVDNDLIDFDSFINAIGYTDKKNPKNYKLYNYNEIEKKIEEGIQREKDSFVYFDDLDIWLTKKDMELLKQEIEKSNEKDYFGKYIIFQNLIDQKLIDENKYKTFCPKEIIKQTKDLKVFIEPSEEEKNEAKLKKEEEKKKQEQIKKEKQMEEIKRKRLQEKAIKKNHQALKNCKLNKKKLKN